VAIVAIVATAKNLAIGKNNRLPWHYKADLRFFKRTTVGNAVVMGWNTWFSIGKPLPDRLNIVLSRHHRIENAPGVLVLRERAEVLALARFLKGDLFIIGGAGVYETFRADIGRWFVTEIPHAVEDADTFMPPDFLDDFRVSAVENIGDDLQVKFYERNE
jgi:dihydrofolate reductase